jgi:major vault protein
MSTTVVRLGPYQYVHVLDNNSNITKVLVGPLTYTLFDHERMIQKDPQQCISIPPTYYAVVENPVARDQAGAIVLEKNGQAKIRDGDSEIRFAQDPFPLYPGENLSAAGVQPLKVLGPHNALRLKALRSVKVDGKDYTAGDEWIFKGPATYIPRVEVSVEQELNAIVVARDQALRLRAIYDFKDSKGVPHKAGEEWLHEDLGSFIPPIEVEVAEVINATILTARKAVHVEARFNFTDKSGKVRKAGEKWLLTNETVTSFIPSPNERIVAEVQLTALGPRDYCVVVNPFDPKTGTNRLGEKVLRKGRDNFFLHPGETLDGGSIQKVQILGKEEALLLTATRAFKDGDDNRKPGDRWMLRGPCDYIPPIEVTIVEKRSSIPLDENEGVYIRNVSTGKVRAHIGSTVMLNADEELWEKPLSPLIEELLAQPRLTKIGNEPGQPRVPRPKHKVVSCNVPHNSLIQVYDYKKKTARVVMGPEAVLLDADEEFTVISLSGKKPKVSDYIKTLCLHLGPDFMTDIIIVETSDHARLQLQLSYNWEFDTKAPLKDIIFSVPDFVGDACKAIASRIRGSVAGCSFDEFHKNSSNIIQRAVFGADQEGQSVKPILEFKENGLIITAVDIHSVDPVDPKTREALVKSVQLAIEITTTSQEAAARQIAATQEQDARGRLERQIIEDKASAEEKRKILLTIEATNAAIETCGSSKAQSKAEAEARLIEGQTEVDLAGKRAQAAENNANTELELENARRMLELDHRAEVDRLEIHKKRALAEIEAEKFKKTIAAIGKPTIKALATAGPELQAKLLKGLGLQGYLVTDGTNPINLFNTARGMTAPATTGAPH